MKGQETMMESRLFDSDNEQFKADAARLLAENFPDAYGDCAMEEVELCLSEERVAVMAVEQGHLVGFVGAIPQYDMTGWELHPLVVNASHRLRGVGAMLVKALEEEVARRGGVTIYLGTDDEFGRTSLSNTDLYEDTYGKIVAIKNLKDHPFSFYQKIGYKIVGVIPDASGIGKPDIWMAKRISN
jgi:aminoglycoside 6'-N-acetyltransferase I